MSDKKSVNPETPLSGTEAISEFQQLLEGGNYLQVPDVGDSVKGVVISASRREVRLDIGCVGVGVIRGRELFSESKEYSSLKPGDTVEATIMERENENGELELSFRFAGQKKAWEELRRLFTIGEMISVKVLE